MIQVRPHVVAAPTSTPAFKPTADRLADLVDEYLAAAEGNGASQATLARSYGFVLKQVFLPFCEAQGVATARQAQERGPKLMTDFSLYLARKHKMTRLGDTLVETKALLSPHTRSSYLRNVEYFAHWLERSRVASLQVPKLRAKRVVKVVLAPREVDRIEQEAVGERNKLIIRTLFWTGMRADELCKLQPSDLQQIGRLFYLRVQGKGGEERNCTLEQGLYRRLKNWSGQNPNAVYLFESDRKGQPLTPSGVLQMLADLGQRAIGRKVNTHLFRHSMITDSIIKGVPLPEIARQVGHKSLAMIQRNYSHLTDQSNADAMLKRLR